MGAAVSSALRAAIVVSALAAALAGCGPGISVDAPIGGPSEGDRTRYVQRRLEASRAFESQGRFEASESMLRSALRVAPDDPLVLRALARRLEESERTAEAAPLRQRADQIDPPPALPAGASDLPSSGLVLLILPGTGAAHATLGLAGEWPDRHVPLFLARRARERLPAAEVNEVSPASVPEAQQWLRARRARAALSITVQRASCGRSLKDGPFALASLEVAAASGDGLLVGPLQIRETDDDPAGGEACSERALARALERVIASDEVRRVVSGGAGPFGPEAARRLFPALEQRAIERVDRAREQLDAGRVGEADAELRRARAIDPESPELRAGVDELRASVELAQSLVGGGVALRRPAPRELAPLTPAARSALEARLADERDARERWIAALRATLDGNAAVSDDAWRRATPTEALDPPTAGLRLAREQTQGAIELRALLADDGRAATIFYVDRSTGEPVLREEARTSGGRADTWTVMRGGRVVERFEDRDGDALPETRFVLDEAGALARVDRFATGAERTPEHVLRFEAGRAVSDERDTDRDGRIDRVDRLGPDGAVTLREEDLDGDGRVDLRTRLQAGRVVSRARGDDDASRATR